MPSEKSARRTGILRKNGSIHFIGNKQTVVASRHISDQDWARVSKTAVLDAAVVKSSAINALYNTNVKWVVPVAKHVSKVMGCQQSDLVESISNFKTEEGDQKILLSFSSKLCHFFVDEDEYPIYDDLAVRALKRHGIIWKAAKTANYTEFKAGIARLRQASKIKCSSREMDKYLWLLGAWQKMQDAFNSGKPVKVNKELRKLFAQIQEREPDLLRSFLEARE